KPLTKGEIQERLAKIEKRNDAGGVEHPYVDAEVSRLGAADDSRTGAGRSFQVLVSGTGSSGRGSSKTHAMAPPPLELMPTAHAAEPTASENASTNDAAASETPQDAFVHDIERTFKAELAPQAFTDRKVEPDPAAPGKQRISFDVNLAAGKTLDVDAVQHELAAEGLADVSVTANVVDGRTVLHLRSGPTDADPRALEHVEGRLKSIFETKFAQEISNPFPYKASIGSSVAESLKYRAILAILLMLLVVIVYLAFRFEFKMGLAAALCLFHDVLVVLGFMMLLDVTSRWTGIDAKQSLLTISAYLTIIGYSINDTIVTFDRMRENLAKWDPKTGLSSGPHAHEGKETYEDVLNRSINETLGRTILTSLTVFLTLVVLAFSGVKSLEAFVLAMLVGVVFGTYSSIVIATPILLVKPRRLAMICAAELGYFIIAGVIGSYLRL
ncbi:MAG TPA: protein translocase subunit SecF, partial [Planctomycetota bacterium]|nr:protein translocase subunit SecF [Planctomycetota bacterium]